MFAMTGSGADKVCEGGGALRAYTGSNAKDRAAFIAALGETPEFAGANHDDAVDPSDARFARVVAMLIPKPAPDPSSSTVTPSAVGRVKASRSAFEVTVRAKDNPEFHAWLVAQGDRLLQSWHDEWQSARAKRATP